MMNTQDYRIAPGGDGPHASEWKDKPHRLIYDLCLEIERLQRALPERPLTRDGVLIQVGMEVWTLDDTKYIRRIQVTGIYGDLLELENARLIEAYPGTAFYHWKNVRAFQLEQTNDPHNQKA